MEINLGIFSQRTAGLFLAAVNFAIRMGHRFIGSEHLLWALLQDQGRAGQILRSGGLDQALVEEYLRQYDWDAKADGRMDSATGFENADFSGSGAGNPCLSATGPEPRPADGA